MTTPRRTLAARLSEAEAIADAKQGDGDCFKLLYALHKRRVYSVCCRMTRACFKNRFGLKAGTYA